MMSGHFENFTVLRFMVSLLTMGFVLFKTSSIASSGFPDLTKDLYDELPGETPKLFENEIAYFPLYFVASLYNLAFFIDNAVRYFNNINGVWRIKIAILYESWRAIVNIIVSTFVAYLNLRC
ncbi:hypothetical protein O9G_002799 [Rozella allomycis CSF55]|uniref:Uncharacterized protein n=1 Tax=Rozella allomycis (strain CSF55) TaxID=988480 RepID=A0A075AQQ4_ROZAC|nr:hypothetical protein O9G_002799 [Rozella allomycis CSF55]|eukprot:EPZ30922.1 hypothetical protein O9G_002799 [Rozella allomycis CSF55]